MSMRGLFIDTLSCTLYHTGLMFTHSLSLTHSALTHSLRLTHSLNVRLLLIAAPVGRGAPLSRHRTSHLGKRGLLARVEAAASLVVRVRVG
jgi:hypothetical protein